jgi:hypothetical protein
MTDVTNAGVPGPGGQLSGDVHRQAAIKRLKIMEQRGAAKNSMSPAAPAVSGAGNVSAAPRGY